MVQYLREDLVLFPVFATSEHPGWEPSHGRSELFTDAQNFPVEHPGIRRKRAAAPGRGVLRFPLGDTGVFRRE